LTQYRLLKRYDIRGVNRKALCKMKEDLIETTKTTTIAIASTTQEFG
jgi:hypothetical protein